jgi:hypothetical protein
VASAFISGKVLLFPMTAMSRDGGDLGDPHGSARISVISEISNKVLLFPLMATSRDGGDLGDF